MQTFNEPKVFTNRNQIALKLNFFFSPNNLYFVRSNSNGLKQKENESKFKQNQPKKPDRECEQKKEQHSPQLDIEKALLAKASGNSTSGYKRKPVQRKLKCRESIDRKMEL